MNDRLDTPSLAPADLGEAPDLIEPVVAFRKWRVVDGRLRSLYEPNFWLDAMQQAECHAHNRGNPPHEAPQSGCTCGIYASFKPDYDFPTVDYRGVSGIVTAWGNVEVHADGLRAQWVQVEALSSYERWSSRQAEAVRAVADELGLDVVDLFDLEAAAGRYGVRLDPRVVEIDRSQAR
jgi:hypothetical protein